VVIQKVRWGRSKDLDDARDIIAVQGESLDWGYIERWTIPHGTFEALQQIRKLIP
jgi:hypothetical protein